MGTFQLNSYHVLSSKFSAAHSFKHSKTLNRLFKISNTRVNSKCISVRKLVRAIGTVPEQDQATDDATEAEEEDEEPSIGFAFVNPVLLPDGTPDVHLRTATGGQKLRDIMLDNGIDLYGPYARPLLNCGGGGTCASCMVEVIEGRELLTPKTDKEKEHLKRKPKNWRLACQTTVGTAESRGMVVIQQLPEWKAHEWNYAAEIPDQSE